jgi:chorismate mutase/prephenate dehydratase
VIDLDLSRCRKRIDRTDEQIVQLLTRRAKLALEAAKMKRIHGVSIFDPKRESEIFSRVTSPNCNPLSQ